jgi:hypothetical protein
VNFSIFNSRCRRYSTGLFVSLALVSVSFVAASELLLRQEFIGRDFLLGKADLFASSHGMDAIFGDSRAWYGLTGIPGFVNHAFGGDSLYDTGEKIRWHFRDRIGFRTIIALSPENFMTRTSKNGIPDERARDIYRQFFFRDSDSAFLRLYFFSDYYRARIFKIWETWLRKGEFTGPFRLTADGANLAAGRMEPPSEAAVDIATKIAQGASHALSTFPTSPSGTYLGKLLKWLEVRQATVCIITPPPFHLYSDPLSGSMEYRAFFNALQQEVESHGFRYVNYFWNNLPITDFTDAFHMNSDGAQDFSARVARDCV